jgi:nucleoside-diphosphate-sugar epimerase
MNILIVGSSGFIGSRLVESLSRAGHRVIETTRRQEKNKVLLKPWVKIELADFQVDLIINAAGKYTRSNQDFDLIESNIGIAASIALAASEVSLGLINLNSYFELLPESSENARLLYTRTKKIADLMLSESFLLQKKSHLRVYLFDNFDKDLSRGKLVDQLILSAVTKQTINVNSLKVNLNLLPLNEVISSIEFIVSNYETFKMQHRIDLKNSHTISVGEIILVIEQVLEMKVHCRDLKIIPDLFVNETLSDLEYQLNRKALQIEFSKSLEKILLEVNSQ